MSVLSARVGPDEAIVSDLVVAPAASWGEQGNVCRVPVNVLIAGDSPRHAGVDSAHVARLAECAAELPAIVVHRQTMRVIDGMHRLQAAIRNGRERMAVTFFDGSDDEAFVLAVELNVKHGLPLSLSDRKAAARRILVANPGLSDRAIGSKTGLSDKSVAAIRNHPVTGIPHPETRRGRDGRVYPIRRRVSGDAGPGPLSGGGGTATPGGGGGRGEVKQAALERLRSDPSVRDKEAGRQLLRWLFRYAINVGDLPRCAGAVPPHRAPQVAALARQAADAWLELARNLEAS